VRTQAFPIGIDVDEFDALTHAKEDAITPAHEKGIRAGAFCWASSRQTTGACHQRVRRFANC
jgi:hypothetical protein